MQFLPSVNLLMFFKPSSQSKALPALGTLVQSHLPVAGPKMFQQVVPNGKALSAFRASEGRLPTVNTSMFNKLVFPTKGLPAPKAIVQLLPSVGFLVSQELEFVLEDFPAYLTLVKKLALERWSDGW